METKKNSDEIIYDVALSFAGEDREYVSIVAKTLRSNGIEVFYDEFQQVKLWGKDLGIQLDKVYRLQSKFCVIFISKFYLEKAWTNHEIRSALSRAIEERGEYILPARFDDTDLPGIQATLGYIDISKLPPEEFAVLVLEKISKFDISRKVKAKEIVENIEENMYELDSLKIAYRSATNIFSTTAKDKALTEITKKAIKVNQLDFAYKVANSAFSVNSRDKMLGMIVHAGINSKNLKIAEKASDAMFHASNRDNAKREIVDSI